MNFNASQVKSAAKQELQRHGRTSFSSEGFSSSEVDVIASAIAAAIGAYDEQQPENKKG